MAITPKGIVLDKGLDLINPKVVAPEGTLLDCLNYETVDFVGARRIDGLVRYDGRVSPSQEVWFEIGSTSYAGTTATDFPTGSLLAVSGDTQPFGIAVGARASGGTKYILYVRINVDLEPAVGENVVVLGSATTFGVTTAPADGRVAAGDAEDILAAVNSYNDDLRDRIGALEDTVIGLHWFRDRLYAVVDGGVGTATMWESRSEAQAIADGDDASEAGWRECDLGWEVTYTNGDAASGELTRIQRGVENNFDYDAASTSTVGTAGKWITFKNGAQIGADPAQGGTIGTTSVNIGSPGWKDTNDTTAFATTGTALDSEDTHFLYGDINFDTGRASNRINVASYSYPLAGSLANEPSDLFSCNARAPLVLTDLSGIASAIPDGSVIVGIEVEVNYDTQVIYSHRFKNTRGSAHPYAGPWIADRTIMSGYLGRMNLSTNAFEQQGAKQTTPLAVESTAANYDTEDVVINASATDYLGEASITDQDLVIGGSTNIWGVEGLSKEDLLNDPTFGIALFADALAGDHPTGEFGRYLIGSTYVSEQANNYVRVKLNRVRIKLTYQQGSARYYFSDADGVVSADLVFYTVWDGSLTAGTAEGQMQLTNITAVSGTKSTIKDGDTMHLSDDIVDSTQVAVIASDAVVNGLPNLADITENDSRYQFITANFFGDDDWDAFYGVSGAGRAFSYDGEYFIKIYTQEDAEKDKPRHIAYHSGHLALGFRSGSVQFSALGEPELFGLEGALRGAAERPQGDRITGLLPLNGMTLAVFCENSIRAISGSVSVDFADQVLAPNTGALEYTVVDMGMPIFCDSRGISTLSQSEKYGDFVGQRLSYSVNPWIAPRLIRNTNLFSIQNAAGVVCAIPVRSKNQYRLFFRDGNIVTMNWNGPEAQPTFTFQKYYLNQATLGDDSEFIVPIAWSSQVDDRGLERIHVAHYSPLSDLSSNYVYELEKGWSFDGQYIPHFLETNWTFGDGGVDYIGINKVRVFGLTKGIANVKLSASGIDDQFEDAYDETETHICLPRTPASTLYTDFKAATDLAYLSNRGLAVQLKFEGNGTLNVPEPSYVLQVLNVFARTGGKIDG